MNQLETIVKDEGGMMDENGGGAGAIESNDYFELKPNDNLYKTESDIEIISDDDSSDDLHDFMFSQNSQMDDLNYDLSDNAQENYSAFPSAGEEESVKKYDSFPMYDNDDSDVHFFKSIIPFLKQITNPTTKLKVRLEIQDIILSAISSTSEADAK
jgi:hypothetical protein